MMNFLTHEECQSLIEEYKDKLRDSTLLSYSGYGAIPKGMRGSWSARTDSNNLLVSKICDRISSILEIDKDRFEDLEVIRYKMGDEFKLHSDFFKSFEALQACEENGNRIATIIIYLNDNFEGGATDFPLLNVWVEPEEGKFLFFDYSNPDLKIKSSTAHHGRLVTKGEKWIAALWIRERKRTANKPG